MINALAFLPLSEVIDGMVYLNIPTPVELLTKLMLVGSLGAQYFLQTSGMYTKSL